MASRKITKAQVPIRNRGDNLCPYHDREVLLLACINCGGELLCAKCITSQHERHEFESITKFADEKKTIIQEFIKKFEKTLPTIANNLQSIDKQIKESTKHFKNLEKEITLQGEKMKEQIDRITKEMLRKCREIKKENSELLSKYRNDVSSLYTQLTKIIDECKDTLKTHNTILTIDTEKDIQQEFTMPNVPKYKTVEFKAGPKSSKHLQDDFGSLSVKEGQILVPQEFRHAPKSDVVKQYRFDDSTVVSEFIHSTYISSVEKSTSDSVWLSHNYDEYISLVTIQGEVKHKIQLDSYVRDISVSPVTGNLWLCDEDHDIYEVSGNKPTKSFTTDSWSWYLCMTPDNNIVVSTDNVTVYSTTGQVLHSTQGSGSVVSPHSVTVCTSTGDIAVCDSDDSDYGGKDKPHVSVFNSKLDLQYQYYGPPASVMKSDFDPIDVVYDTQGHLLIADNNNKCIQLVSGEGQFLTVVHTDTVKPRTLTLIQDGVLCVGFYDKKVKVITYRV